MEGSATEVTCETTTNWNCVTISGPTQEGDTYLQGSYGVSAKASSKAGELYYDFGSGTELDFTSGGTEYENLIYIWINVTTLGTLDTLANRGLAIRVYTDLSNWCDFVIAGSGSVANFGDGKGGFRCFALDPTLPPTYTNGTMNLASVRYIGIHIDTTGSAKVENLIVDHMIIAKGIRLTGSHTDGWDDMVNYCTDHANRAWGMIQLDDSGSIICSGKIIVGSTSQTAVTSIVDSAKKFKYYVKQYYNEYGQWMPMVKDDYFGIEAYDAGSYTTTIEDGIVVGSDSGRNGSVIEGSEDVDCYIDFTGLTNASSVVKMYNTSIKNMRTYIKLENDADHQYFSCVFDECGQVDAGANPDFRNCIFSNTKDLYLPDDAVDSAQFYNGSTYTDETTDINNATTDDVSLPYTSGDIIYIGQNKPWNKLKLEISTPATAAYTLTYEYYNGSWVTLSPTKNTINGWYQDGEVVLEFEPPSDWATTTVNGAGPYYYIRINYSSGGSGTPLGEQGWVSRPGSAFLWYTGGDLNIQDSSFINNYHSIEQTVAEEVDYNDLNFSGNTYDIHFTPSSGNLTVNNVGTSNASTYQIEGSGSVSIITPVTYTLTDLKVNSNVVLLKQSDNSVIDEVENSGTTFQYNYNWAGDVAIYVVIHHIDYNYIRFSDTLTASNKSTKVFQQTDRWYSNP